MGFFSKLLGVGGLGLPGMMYQSGQDQAKAAKSAAQLQADAANTASNNTLAQYQQTRADLQPYVQTGQLGNEGLAQGMRDGSLTRAFNLNDFHADPGYQFTKQQGMDGIQSSAAARGSLLSGATLKALDSYNSNLANQQYQQAYSNYNADQSNRYNRLMNVAELGQNSAALVGKEGSVATAQANDYNTSGASALAAGLIGAQNAKTGAMNNMIKTGLNAAAIFI